MTSQKWVRLFTRTLLLGAIATILTSMFVKSSSYTVNLNPIDLWEIFGVLLWFTGIGLLFSIVSQTGFFAYLVVNQIGRSVFKGFWIYVQIVLIVFALFDLVYFPYKGAGEDASLLPYLITALVIFLFSLAVAYVKVKETNKTAFIPAIFFMVVITILEWVPVLRTGDSDWMLLMIAPLLACNTYQLLILHKIVKKDGQEDGKALKTSKKVNTSNTNNKSNKKKK